MKNNAFLLNAYRNYNIFFFSAVVIGAILFFTTILFNIFSNQLPSTFLFAALVVASVYIEWRCVGWYIETSNILTEFIKENLKDSNWNQQPAAAIRLTKATFFKRMKIASIIELFVVLVGILYMILK